jgi:hypothetical protein
MLIEKSAEASFSLKAESESPSSGFRDLPCAVAAATEAR